jgi:hypothetical protein
MPTGKCDDEAGHQLSSSSLPWSQPRPALYGKHAEIPAAVNRRVELPFHGKRDMRLSTSNAPCAVPKLVS